MSSSTREMVQAIITGGLTALYAFVSSMNTGTPVSWSPTWLVGGLLLGIGVSFFSDFTTTGRRLDDAMHDAALVTVAVLGVGLLVVLSTITVLDLNYNGDVLTGLLGLALSSLFWAIAPVWRERSASRSPDVE